MTTDVLIVDDETAFAAGVCEYFTLMGVPSAYVGTTEDALAFVADHPVRLVLLDINLSEGSGFAACKALRERQDVPIWFLSARTSTEDQLLALGIGGDDYIPKPVTLSVLLAKVKAALRRMEPPRAGDDRLRLDPEAGRVYRGTTALPLRAREYALLAYLMCNPGRVISKDELLAELWSDSGAADGTLNVHMRRLREKVEADPNEPTLIKTVWGVGYVYDPDGEAAR